MNQRAKRRRNAKFFQGKKGEIVERERAHLLAYGFFFLRLPFGYTVHTTVEIKKEEKAPEGFHFIQKRALSFHSQVCVCV